MNKVLVLFTTRDGQTQKIVDHIVQTWQAETGDAVQYEVRRLESNMKIDNLADYQFVLIGSSIRYGHYHSAMKQFVKCHAKMLNEVKSGFFGVNLVARKPEKQTPETNSYTRKFLDSSAWKPTETAVFAGALRYPRYGFLDRVMIQLIMRMTGGETDSTKEVEYTDWLKITQFANILLAYFYSKNCQVS